LNEIGSDVAAINSSVNWNMPDNFKNEMEFALFTMFEPVPLTIMGTKPSDMATGYAWPRVAVTGYTYLLHFL